MNKPLSERLEVHAAGWPTVYESDRQNIVLLREAAELARNVERLDVAQCCCGCERAVCNSCGAELGKLMPRVALVEVE